MPVAPPRSRRLHARRRMAVAALAALCLSCGSGDDSSLSDTRTTEAAPTTTPTTEASPSTGPADPSATAAPIWQPVVFEGDGPTARSGAVMAAATDGSLWLHGGLAGGSSMADLWRFDDDEWRVLTPTGPAPSARQDHVAVWDSTRDRLVIAFGQNSSGTVFGDVWSFDPVAMSWSRLADGGPAARYGSCAVVDRAGRMVITHGFSSTRRFDDTWAFDLATSTWTDISPQAGARPVARCLHACAYDGTTDELTLFGGRQDADPFLGDTWRLGAEGWTELPATGPEPRVRSRAALVVGGMHVIGGLGDDGLIGDTWILDGGAWTPSTTGAPADRDSAAVAQGDGVAWLFGGEGADGELADLWRLG